MQFVERNGANETDRGCYNSAPGVETVHVSSLLRVQIPCALRAARNFALVQLYLKHFPTL